MIRHRSQFLVSVLLLVVFILSACGGSAATPTLPPAPTQTLLPPTETSTPAPTATLVPTSTPDRLPQCKFPVNGSYNGAQYGFPKPSFKMRSVGDVKTVILFADFADAPATQTPEEMFSMLSPNAENFLNTISYGKLNWTLEPHLVWLRLSKPSSYYGSLMRSFEGHKKYIQEAVDLADAEVDFSTADAVAVIVPIEAKKIPYGPAFAAAEGDGYQADGKTFDSGMTSGADFGEEYRRHYWLLNYTGYGMGLPLLISYTPDPGGVYGYFGFAGGFSLMGGTGWGPEFFAFERWQLGWLEDAQIFCLPDGEQTMMLTPVEVAGGTKAIVVPVSPNKLLVVESRHALGFDTKLPKEGALVYTVDNSVPIGSGPLMIYPSLQKDRNRYDSILAVGESTTVEGVTVTVMESTDEGDTVKVTVTK